MKSLFFLALALVFGVSLAQSAQKWLFSYQPVKGRYLIYGGALGDPLPPTSKDKQIAFRIDGKAAKQLFEAMGRTCATPAAWKAKRVCASARM